MGRRQSCVASLRQWLFYIPPGLTLKILRFSHTMHLCFMCTSEQTASILLDASDWFP